MLDSLIAKVDTLGSTSFYKLGTLKLIVGKDSFLLNRYSALVCRISEDNLLSVEEKNELEKAWKHPSFKSIDSLWYLSGEKRRTLDSTALQQTRKSTSYTSTGFSYWKDSIVNNVQYKKYKISLDSCRKALLRGEIIMRHNWAIEQSILFLDKYIMTVQLEGNKALNDPKEIKQYLDTFK
jgi:hypothetical protein